MLEQGQIVFSPKPLNLHRRHTGSKTIESFNASQLQEILSVQKKVRDLFDVDLDLRKRSMDYSNKLYHQFGLSAGGTDVLYADPRFSHYIDDEINLARTIDYN